MIRSTLAVLGGFAATVVSVTSLIALLQFLARDQFPDEPGPYTGAAYVLYIEIGFSLLAAMAGGYVCAWIARHQTMTHALVLAGILVVLGAATIATDEGLKPMWSSIAIAVVGPIGILAGAHLRAYLSV